jgi:hypothetical protein
MEKDKRKEWKRREEGRRMEKNGEEERRIKSGE